MGLYKTINKLIEVIYRLNLLLNINIYLVYYITILELVSRNYKPLVINKIYIRDKWKINNQLKCSGINVEKLYRNQKRI